MIKLVVSDMDGTLLGKSKGVSIPNRNAIQRLSEHNIEFAIASGRDYNGVYQIIHELGIECEAILGNGAQYVDCLLYTSDWELYCFIGSRWNNG